MVQITYISPDELYFAAAVAPNVSVLEAALAHGRAGISGDRGACTSCRVHIGADWFDRIDPPPTRPLAVAKDLDGLIVRASRGVR